MRSAVLLLLGLVCCRSAPTVQPDAESILQTAEQRLAAGDPLGCRDLLLAHGKGEFPPSLQPRHVVALAAAQIALDDPAEAFQVLRSFADDHPHSDLRDRAIDLEYQAGKLLCASDRGFLFFWSDRARGRACLEHLTTRYPESQYHADALRILGEMAYADGDYERAEARFADLLRERPESEWAPLARFRYAMSIVASLAGVDYDLDRMQSAAMELKVFLDNPPENPEFVQTAQAELQKLLEWQSERHLLIAQFYADVKNRFGQVHHLRRAAEAQFAETAAAATARARLAELGEPVEPPVPTAPRGGTAP